MMSWLQKKAKKDNAMAKDVLRVYDKVLQTLEFLNQPESVLIYGKTGRDLSYYRERLPEIFGSTILFTPITLCSVVFDINPELSKEKKENNAGIGLLSLSVEREVERSILEQPELPKLNIRLGSSLPIPIPRGSTNVSESYPQVTSLSFKKERVEKLPVNSSSLLIETIEVDEFG
jgi:hypothetical protein